MAGGLDACCTPEELSVLVTCMNTLKDLLYDTKFKHLRKAMGVNVRASFHRLFKAIREGLTTSAEKVADLCAASPCISKAL